MQLLLSGAVGLFLFFAAPPLARSIAFRISVGGTLSVLLCTLIVGMYCFRYGPRACFFVTLDQFTCGDIYEKQLSRVLEIFYVTNTCAGE